MSSPPQGLRVVLGALVLALIMGAYGVAAYDLLNPGITPEADRRLDSSESRLEALEGLVLGNRSLIEADLAAAREEIARLAKVIRRLERRLKKAAAAIERTSSATEAPVSATRTVSSTAYCLTGTMANGETVYDGAVAGNLWPLGTRVHVVELGRTFTVADRIGHSSELDIAMPGRCSDALEYGRRTVTVRVLG